MKLKNSLHLLIVYLFLAHLSSAQDYQEYNFSGSNTSKQEREELLAKLKREHEYLDSLRQLRNLDSLEQRFAYINTDTASYFGMTFFFEHVPGEYDKLLDELSDNGFNTSEGASAFGYGFTLKKRRFIHELNVGFIWGDKMYSDNREEVQITGSNVSYLFGFDLLNTRKLSLFPFVTILHQGVSLEYTRKPEGGQTHDNFLDVPANVNHLELRKNALRLGFGGEIDYYFPKSNREGGVIFGFRYGMNYTAAEGNYKSERRNVGYDPDITLRDSYFAFVLKFYGRLTFRTKY